jgi:uncharacterized protein YbaR (Trm112 family)
MTEWDPLREAREVYARGGNVMAHFRAADRHGRNSSDAVLVSYDLQSGTYRSALDDADYRARSERYARAILRDLDPLDFDSMLDAGTGEATTLMPVLAGLRTMPTRVAAFDLAWSRVAHAREHARGFPTAMPTFFTASLFEMPVVDGAFDLVFTSHALEPNGGRERAGLAELARASRRWVALFEPSYELGGEDTRRHIEAHGYVRGLREAAESLGLTVVRHHLLPERISPVNETAVLVLKVQTEGPAPGRWLACPRCGRELRDVKGHLFCGAEGLVYPILDGIPCLDQRNAVLASAFGDAP